MEVVAACPDCGTPAPSGRFCTTCGKPLPGTEILPAAQDPTQGAVETPGPGTFPSVPVGMVAAAPPWAAPQAPPPPVSRSRLSVLAAMVLAALALSGWAIVHGVERHILSGTLMIVDSDYDDLDPGDHCAGTGGYFDINEGAQVVVRDGNGATLSTTRLSDGSYDGKGCVFTFALPGVKRADFYALSIAGENRGELQYSYKELADDDWSLQLSLGDN